MNKLLNFVCLFFCLLLVQFVWVESAYAEPYKVKFINFTTVIQPKPEFHPPRRILFFVREPKLSFADAVAACASRGNVLAEFKNPADVQFLNNALKNGTMGSLAGVDYIYLGGVYVGPEVDGSGSKFKWFESGTDVTNWGPGQPNKLLQGADEDCIVSFKSPQGPWRIGDGTCVQKFPFICSSIERFNKY